MTSSHTLHKYRFNEGLLVAVKSLNARDPIGWRQDNNLGNSLFLARVQINWPFLEAITRCWDPNSMVFKFGTNELCPTLEECSRLLGMKLEGDSAFPLLRQGYTKELVTFLQIPKNQLEEDESGAHKTCSVDFLLKRHLQQEGDPYNKKIIEGKSNALTLAIVGHFLLPCNETKIESSLCQVIRDVREEKTTLVPMILAELLKSLTDCALGENNILGGCIALLQIWAYEHLPTLINMRKVEYSDYNLVQSHLQRRPSATIESIEDWVKNLNLLKSDEILWKCSWLFWRGTPFLLLPGRHSLVLAGLRGSTPYIPLRVLRQFGYVQFIPTADDLTHDRTAFLFYSAKLEARFLDCWRQSRGPVLELKESHVPATTDEYKISLEMPNISSDMPIPTFLPNPIIALKKDKLPMILPVVDVFKNTAIKYAKRRWESQEKYDTLKIKLEEEKREKEVIYRKFRSLKEKKIRLKAVLADKDDLIRQMSSYNTALLEQIESLGCEPVKFPPPPMLI